MARGVRFTKAERAFIRAAFARETGRTALAILAKLDAADVAAPGVDVGPIEEALMAAARGKVLAMEGGFGRASVMAAAVNATPETAAMVGAWLARTAYFTQPMTLLDVLNKWHTWLPKARATQPPPALEPGLGPNATDGRSPAQAGQATQGRRRPPGFG